MAKGIPRVLGVSSWTPDYEEPDHLPWVDLEGSLGRAIPDTDRVEIFEARQHYFMSLAAYNQGAPQQHVNKLRDRLRALCGELHHIKIIVDDAPASGGDEEKFAQKILGKDAVAGDIEAAFNGLAWQYGGDLRNKFNSLTAECLELIITLIKPNDFAPVTGPGIPDVMAFNELFGALHKAAPRWGFTATENSPDFVKLVMWMIGQSSFRKVLNKIKNARAVHKERVAQAPK